MRILFLTHSFNSLTQRLFLELTRRGHEVSIEFDIHDEVTKDAVALFRPALIVAPYLRRAIPEAIWRKYTCLIVHPGIRGDRGPSALDWAILTGVREWGVTVLQAIEEMDAGPIWAERRFLMRAASKSSLYRNEVTEAAVAAVLEAVQRFAGKAFTPEFPVQAYWRPLMKQEDRAIDWSCDETRTVITKVRASDGSPGVLDRVFDQEIFLFDAIEAQAGNGGHVRPGGVIGWGEAGILRATVDGAVWIGHVRKKRTGEIDPPLKLPAQIALAGQLERFPRLESPSAIRYEERNRVGYLHFSFYNGAMSTGQCEALREAFREACRCEPRVLVLFGGEDFWSNGIHLHQIEAASSPADESWRNIQAMNDLTREILKADQLITISALQGNAGAGGVFLALAADHVYARTGVVLNPHYKAMGNLHGSEYWTYSLPRRVGQINARKIVEARLPIGTVEAKEIGLIDDHFGSQIDEFRKHIAELAEKITDREDYAELIEKKRVNLSRDESGKSLDSYRAEEMLQMKRNFYGFDPSYHIARYNFVHRVPYSRTPRHLAKHRES